MLLAAKSARFYGLAENPLAETGLGALARVIVSGGGTPAGYNESGHHVSGGQDWPLVRLEMISQSGVTCYSYRDL
jgi:hypothetical protein